VVAKKDRLTISIHRAGETIEFSSDLPEVAYHTTGLQGMMGWLEPCVNKLLWIVVHAMHDQSNIHEEGSG
jgi:hypothetical protein